MKCGTKIIPYVMTWDRIVTNFHNRYAKEEISVSDHIEVYVQSIILKKTLEGISFDTRYEFQEDEAKMMSATNLSARQVQPECRNTIQRQNQ
ncbi:unnamed protein product [Thelazia callipaeda]|uniref:Reverse transcriptase domain-containing protein n=1 Tax=Thelazia callipaeda TaxID=103827 RepID=A0A0N5D0H6_THECL|nr:unnamed protein product [Thelazia callipaeda]